MNELVWHLERSLTNNTSSALDEAFPVPEGLPEPLAKLLDRLRRQEMCGALSDIAVARMSDAEVQATLDLQLDVAGRHVPAWAASSLQWLREPTRKVVRIGAGVLLILGGLLAVLPALGAWMLPLGLMILAQDVALLRRPVLGALAWGARIWQRMRRRFAMGDSRSAS